MATKQGFLLIRQSGKARYRVITVEADGKIKPRTGWVTTHSYALKAQAALEKEGWKVDDLLEGHGGPGMDRLFEEEQEEERKTRGGYPFDEVASALQKCIRRGEEEQALYWALELERSGFYKYVWKRLTVICSEDCGIVDPLAALRVGALRDSYMFIRENSQRGGDAVWITMADAVLYLCRCPKNREVAEYSVYVSQDLPKQTIPDYAVDMHTKRGRKMGRGIRFFYDEGAKVSPHVGESRYAKHIPRWKAAGK